MSERYIIKPMGNVPLAVERGQGLHFWDCEGSQYLDAVAGEWVVNLGYRHPKVVAALKAELDNIDYVTPVFNNRYRAELAKKLVEIAPKRIEKVLFALSGAGAVEGAMHLAMRATGGVEFVCLDSAFHGTTFGTMALTYTYPKMVEGSKQGLSRYYAKQIRVPNYYCYRCPFAATYPACDLKCARFIDWAIERQADAKVAGVIVELFQANGSMVPAPREYAKVVREICKRRGAAFIVDEVQSALCRVGDMFASSAYDADPDIITMGKALGAGFPLSAILAAKGYSSLLGWEAGFTLMSTPPICAGSIAMIDVMLEEKLAENAREVGAFMVDRLNEMKDKYPLVGEVRGMGLMIGVELVLDRKTKQPAHELTQYLYDWALQKEKLLLGKTGPVFGNFGNIIKFKPAVNLTRADAEEILKRFERALAATQKKKGK
jgi:4-aminobutyrate aminotransferase-like enzyme